MLKRQNGQALTRKEQQRLAARMSAEDETRRAGGVVTLPLARESDPNAAYEAGARSVSSTTPDARDAAEPSGVRTLSATNRAESGGVGLTRIPPRFGGQGHGGIDVNSYTGSMFADPDGPMGARPIAGYQRPETADEAADNLLKHRAGLPSRPVYDSSDAKWRTPKQSVVTPQPVAQPTGERESAAMEWTRGLASRGNQSAQLALYGFPRTSSPTPPVTTPAREMNNPMSAPTPVPNRSMTTDLSASGPWVSPQQFFGGTGPNRRGFQTQDSANIYDAYVRKLFGDGNAAPAVSGTPLTRAPVVAPPQPVAPHAPAPKPAVAQMPVQNPTPRNWAAEPSTHEVLAGAVNPNPSWGAMKEFGRRLYDKITPATDAVGTPLRRLGRQPAYTGTQ